jgi:putative intracellular protease/amidase
LSARAASSPTSRFALRRSPCSFARSKRTNRLGARINWLACGRRQHERLDQARIIVPHVADSRVDRPALARTIGSLFDSGKIVSAVCHGPAGLVSAKRSDGRSLVDGKRVNSFTNSEEKAVGLTEVVPFLLETRLRELGGRFEGGPEWQPFAVRDGNLITGQNPMSSELVARRVIDALETQEVA